MFGLPALLAISILPYLVRFARAFDETGSPRRLHMTQQHSEEREQPDGNEEDGDRQHRRMHLLSVRPLHSGDRREWLRPTGSEPSTGIARSKPAAPACRRRSAQAQDTAAHSGNWRE